MGLVLGSCLEGCLPVLLKPAGLLKPLSLRLAVRGGLEGFFDGMPSSLLGIR